MRVLILVAGAFLPAAAPSKTQSQASEACVRDFNSKQFERAAKSCPEAAEREDAEAQFKLGLMYVGGNGVSQNVAAALNWIRKASEHGSVDAQFTLGLIYEAGKVVPKDEVEAVRWYRRAAEQGNVAAQSWLGAKYFEGRGVAIDEAEGVRWIRKAADQGNAAAQSFLGTAYAQGRGVAKNEAEAIRWYRKAAAQGDTAAQQSLQRRDKVQALEDAYSSMGEIAEKQRQKHGGLSICQDGQSPVIYVNGNKIEQCRPMTQDDVNAFSKVLDDVAKKSYPPGTLKANPCWPKHCSEDKR